MKHVLICCMLLAAFIQCKPKEAPVAESTSVIPPMPEPAAMVAGDTFPGMDREFANKLWDEVDHIDYMYHELPFSASLSEQESIRGILKHLSTSPAVQYPSCKPIAKIFFHAKGNLMAQADFYYSAQCVSMIFYKDGKPAFGNKLTPEAMTYYQQMFSSLQVKPKE